MSELRSCFITLSLCIGLTIVFFWTGPLEGSEGPTTFTQALLAVPRHGDLMHLSGNLLVIFFGGLLAEDRLGTRWFTYLVLCSAVIPTIVQYAAVGPKFLGASGLSYALLTYGVMTNRTTKAVALVSVSVLTLLALEFAYLSAQVAVYVHASGAALGGGLVMFERLLGSRGPSLKPMQLTHISRVVEIIGQTDTDDAAEAEQDFLNDGLGRMFVLMEKGNVLGVTGYSLDPHVSDIAWLSWTYLDDQHKGSGLGGQMLDDLLGKLKGLGVRKIFMATSDYDHFGKKIYAAAHKMYEDFGANVELTVPDYHAIGEAKLVYGLDNPEFDAGDAPHSSDRLGIAVTGVGREPETEDVYGLTWEDSPVGLAGIDHAIEMAKGKGAREIVIALPSDLSDENATGLSAHNFKICGSLKAYYSPGLHQIWWKYSMAVV